MTRRTVARGSLTMEQDITKPMSRIYTFEDLAPVGEVMPMGANQQFVTYREYGTTQVYTGAERDGEYVLAFTNSPGSYSDTHWHVNPPSSFLGRGRVSLYVRGYLRNASLSVGLQSTAYTFIVGFLYHGDDAHLIVYGHHYADPQETVSHYDTGQGVVEGWNNLRIEVDFDVNTISSRWWGGDFSAEPDDWNRVMTSDEFGGGVLDLAPSLSLTVSCGETNGSGDFITEIAYFGYEVTP